MITYKPLDRTLDRLGISTYHLIYKCKIPSNTLYRIKCGKSVTTKTIDKLCSILECTVADIMEYIPDDSEEAKELLQEQRLFEERRAKKAGLQKEIDELKAKKAALQKEIDELRAGK